MCIRDSLLDPLVFLENLVRHPGERPVHRGLVHHRARRRLPGVAPALVVRPIGPLSHLRIPDISGMKAEEEGQKKTASKAVRRKECSMAAASTDAITVTSSFPPLRARLKVRGL